jgi:regulatory helix-turn-helix LysR family protein
MISFGRLRVLHAVATYGSMNAAASVLSVTNSAISQQIAKLERELDQRHVQRTLHHWVLGGIPSSGEPGANVSFVCDFINRERITCPRA